MKIVIAVNAVLNHDAIGNHVMFMYDLFKSRGYSCFIYCENNGAGISSINDHEFHDLISDRSNLLIYHHCIYWDKALGFLTTTACKKIIKYHNVTPERFFLGYSPFFHAYCKLGREQTKQICREVPEALWIPDSCYNALDVDADHIKVCPPFNSMDKYETTEIDGAIHPKAAINLLFVGRFVPNKGHRFLVRVLKAYTEYFNKDIVLHLLGKVDHDRYYSEIMDLVKEYRLQDNINIVGEVDDSTLFSYYKGCDCFICASDHEGFCVPLIEAQYLGLPVIAKQGSALGETLGPGQLVLGEDPQAYAAAIDLLSKNPEYRDALIAQGRLNYTKRFDNSVLSDMFLNIITRFAIDPVSA